MAATPRSSASKKSKVTPKSTTSSRTAKSTPKSRATYKTKKATIPTKPKSGSATRRKQRLDSQELDNDDDDDTSSSSEDEDDDGSDFKDDEVEDESVSAAVDSEDDAVSEQDDDDSDDSDDDLVIGNGEGGKKRRKSGGGSASKKGKKGGKSGDDLNLRVVKKIKGIPGPKEDPETTIILPSTLDFLARLAKNNDREWFKERDAQYRHALKNVQTFCQAWVPKAAVADWSLPEMPVKDLMQRIYRDVRFSKSKTPYRECLAFSHSRTGRKGPFALYYVQLGPNGNSLIAAGCWQPEATQLRTLRNAILRDSAPLRRLLNEPKFVKLFGKPDPKSAKRTSVYGHDDALKNAPKMEGVTKEHPEIDLLKLRSLAVAHHFTDDEVLADDFLDKVIEIMEVLAPFVQLLNDWLFPPPSDDEADDDDDNQRGQGDDDDDGDKEEEEEEEDEDQEDEDEE